MKTIEINEKKYEIIEDVKDAIDKDILKEKITDYYDDFDLIFRNFLLFFVHIIFVFFVFP